MHSTRIDRLQSLAAEQKLAAVALVPGPNMIYFTGLQFHLSERPTVAVFAPGQTPAIILPALEADKPDASPIQFRKFVYTDEQGPAMAFQQACAALKLKGTWLGVEGRRMRVLETHYFDEFADGIKFEMAEPLIAKLRMKKDETELARMRQAIAIAERALNETLPYVKVGVSEREVAAELMVRLYRAGSGELPFQPIIASGENGALPHAFITDRKIQPGDLVTIDWGAAVNGYFSDLTRTYAIGEIDPELRRAYDAVKEANAAGRAAASPGKTGQDVDRAARGIINAAGFGGYFMHRTGHGLGLEGHEEPDMKEGETMPLEPGMTFTVEPGIYIPGKGGARIEDDVVITADGAETMTTLPRDFTRLA
ncbi:MAG TPA: aminopeptidase P family protein [Anaerolineales bacterium]|nr:aminopeptidase P family protein [Anaerolineales bacterium]